MVRAIVARPVLLYCRRSVGTCQGGSCSAVAPHDARILGQLAALGSVVGPTRISPPIVSGARAAAAATTWQLAEWPARTVSASNGPARSTSHRARVQGSSC